MTPSQPLVLLLNPIWLTVKQEIYYIRGEHTIIPTQPNKAVTTFLGILCRLFGFFVPKDFKHYLALIVPNEED
jgi:hypothetical protein